MTHIQLENCIWIFENPHQHFDRVSPHPGVGGNTE